MITPSQAVEIQARLDRNRKQQPIPAPETEKQGEDRESKVRAEILAFCAKQWPVWLVKSSRPDQRSTVAVGCHDLTIWAPGNRTLAIELKSKTGKKSPAQQVWAKQMQMLDATVHECRSFADFESILRDMNFLPSPDPAVAGGADVGSPRPVIREDGLLGDFKP